MLLSITSCGGIESENINYTKYNGYSTSNSTTTTSAKNANLTTSKNKSTTKITTSSALKTNSTSKTLNSQPTAKPKGTSQKINKKNISKGNAIKKSKPKSNNKISEKPENNGVAGVNENSLGNDNLESSDKSRNANVNQSRVMRDETTTTLAPLLDTDICYITNKGKKFHRKDCRYLYKSKIEIIVKDAKEQGFSPCSVCKPQ